MRTGDSGVLRFKFKYGVEYIEKNARVMVREGNTKCFGYVTNIYPMHTPPKDVEDLFTETDARIGVFAKKKDKANKENI